MITYIVIKNKKLNEYICSVIKKLDVAETTDFFYTLKECRKKMAVQPPNVLLLGFDFSEKDLNWIDFCTEMREKYKSLKILAVVDFKQFQENKKMLYKLTSGYISTDALPDVIVSAVKAILAGKFFIYNRIGVPKEEPDGELLKKDYLDLLKTTYPELLKKNYQEMTEQESDDDEREMIDKLSQFIDVTERFRAELIKNQLSKENTRPDKRHLDNYLTPLIENLLIRRHSNWDIADMLNISIETVRLYRLETILNLRGQNSMAFTIRKDGKIIELPPREGQLLRLIAAGYSNEEIAEKFFFKSVHTVKSTRKTLIERLGQKNTMTTVIHALRTGRIKMEEIDELLS